VPPETYLFFGVCLFVIVSDFAFYSLDFLRLDGWLQSTGNICYKFKDKHITAGGAGRLRAPVIPGQPSGPDLDNASVGNLQ
jgi:hypothetical protein